MRAVKFDVSPAGLLFWAALYYILDGKAFAALLLPALVHELGHLLMLCMLGMRVKSVCVELRGICITYFGYTGAAGHALAAFCGPAAGFIYAWIAAAAGARMGSDTMCMSAGISLALSLFNMIPALPLDGGRIMQNMLSVFCTEYKTRAVCETLSLVSGAGLLLFGIYALYLGKGAGLIVAAIWLLSCQEGVVKRREIM